MTVFPSSSLTPRLGRLAVFQRLLESLERRRVSQGASVWTDFLFRLPLVLGESEAERMAPYSASDEIQAVCQQAVDGLVTLIRRRHDQAYERERSSNLTVDERQRAVLWPKRFSPRTLPEGSPLRDIVRNALAVCADLDAGLLESWLTPVAGGRVLFERLQAVILKSLYAANEQPDVSGMALLSHLALFNVVLEAKQRIKQAQLKPLSYARLERMVSVALFACVNQAFECASASVGALSLTMPAPDDILVQRACLSPIVFMALPDDVLADEVNPYGLTPVIEELLGPLYQWALEDSNLPQRWLDNCYRSLVSDPGKLSAMLPHAAAESLRRLILEFLLNHESPDSPVDQYLASAYYRNNTLVPLLDGSENTTEITAALRGRHNELRMQGRPTEELEALLGLFERVHNRGAPWVHPGPEDAVSLQELVERYLVHRLDLFARDQIEAARRRVIDRRQSYSNAQLIEEYENGRLYRLSDDQRPFIKMRDSNDEAQLFVDLKGYTRRTTRAKELVMAEFLKSEFYEPILRAARKYVGAGAAVPDAPSIRLANLLGDAAAFSGAIGSLVGLAHDIQAICSEYRNKLSQLASDAPNDSYRRLRSQINERQTANQQMGERLQAELATLHSEVARRRALDTRDLMAFWQGDQQERSEALQQQYRDLQRQYEQQGDASPQRKQLQRALDEIRQAFDQSKTQYQATVQGLKSQSPEALATTLIDLVTHPLLARVRAIEGQRKAMDDELHVLQNALDEELALRRGFGLEAGLFISYGAAAEVLTVDDAIWGTQRVSISERLNEAARGTARNNLVKQCIDRMLATARRERNCPTLELPFSVYILDTRTEGATAETTAHAREAPEDDNQGTLQFFEAALTQHLERQLETDTNRTPHEAHYDIYNLGQALSESALDAYLWQMRLTHFFSRVKVHPSELSPEIREHFFFPDETLVFIIGQRIGQPVGAVEVFRYVGRVMFRGFEMLRPTSVYEIIATQKPFFHLLSKHHLERWLHEAQAHPERKLNRLIEHLSSPAVPQER